MTVRPDFGPEYGEEERESQGFVPEESEYTAEHHETEPAAEDHEAHAPGMTCERCGAVIAASQDARLLTDGHWVHKVCPPHLGGQPAPG